MHSEFSKRVVGSFVARADELKKLDRMMKRISPAKIYAECRDDVRRQFTSIEELIRFENAMQSEIVLLRLESNDFTANKRCTITFSRKWYNYGIDLEITGRDDVVTRLRDDAVTILSGTRPWYGWIADQNAFFVIILLMIAIGLAGHAYLAFFSSTSHLPSKPTSPREDSLVQLFAYALLATLALLAFVLQKTKNWLFPYGVFVIGQGDARHRFREKARWLFVGTVLTTAIGLIRL